ncbi:MAG: hypothetical protein J7L61_04465 [Thermoplasmata archaeon]|nr:hypothetical protein [Thermoplasmata archaeon]
MRCFKTGAKVLLLTMLLMGSLLVHLPNEANAGVRTIVTTGLSPSSQTVDVSPGSTGVVIFSGTVTVQSGERTVVSLKATAQGGTATVSPSGLVFNAGGGTATVSVSVKEPPETSYSFTDVVTLSGTWQSGGLAGQVQESSATIVINQFYRITVSTQQPFQEVTPGKQVFFDLTLENNGNGKDVFALEVEADNLKALTDKGWVINLGTPKVPVEEKQKKHVTIVATTPMGTTLWKNEVDVIKIVVKSENSNGLVKEIYPLYVRQHGMHIPGFEPTFAILALALGAVFVKRRQTRRPGG